MAGQTVTVSVLADTKPMAKAFQGLGQKLGLGKLGTAVGKLGKAVAVGTAAGVAGLGALAVKAVGAASDLEQSMGGVDSIFKDHAGQVHDLAKAADMNLGLTADSYNQLASIIGTTLKSSGTPMKELAGETDKLITRSADLAATFGGPVTDASNAMSSALRGEFEPLRRYGVSLNQAEINARAMADSGKDNAKELTKQEKALATQALIMEQSTDAAGAFARENDTLAGKIERAKAVAGNLAATLGQQLLPYATAAMGYLLDKGVPAVQALGTWAQDHLLPALQRLGEWFMAEGVPRLREFGDYVASTIVPKLQELGAWVTGTLVPALVSMGTWVMNNAAWLGPLAAAILGAAAAFRAIQIAMAAWKVITTAVTVAQGLLNTVLLANPIGLVIVIIAALVAAFVYLWRTNDGFRNALIAAWAAITSAVSKAWAWLQTLPAKFTGMMARVRSAVSAGITAVVGFFTGLPGRALSAAASLTARLHTLGTTALGRLRTAVSTGAGRVVSFVRGIPGRILSALGNLGGLLSGAGRQVIDGFLGSIRAGFDRVKNTLGNLTSMLPDWKGPAARDRSILRKPGQLVIEGLVRGLRESFPEVRRTLGTLTNTLAATELPQLRAGVAIEPQAAVAGPARGRGASPAQRVYQITLQTLDPTPEAGRLIVQAVKDYERMNGSTW